MTVRHLGKRSVHHSQALDDKYRVSEKEFPPELTTQHAVYNGQPVHWFANFGHQHKAAGAPAAARLEEDYESGAAAPLVCFSVAGVAEVAEWPKIAKRCGPCGKKRKVWRSFQSWRAT